MTSFYNSDQSVVLCNGGDDDVEAFESDYGSSVDMLHWNRTLQTQTQMHHHHHHQSTMMHYQNGLQQNCSKPLEENSTLQQQLLPPTTTFFGGYCPTSTTPLSNCSSTTTTPTSPDSSSVKMEPDGLGGFEARVAAAAAAEAALSDDQLVKMSVRDLNYLLQVINVTRLI